MNILKKHKRLFIFLLLPLIAPNMGCLYLDRYPLDRQFRELRWSALYDYLDEEDSLGGRDVNNNGIRDDIERWINEQNYSKEQKQALFLNAKVLRNLLLVDLNDDAKLLEAWDKVPYAIDCTMDYFYVGGHVKEMDVLEAGNANTDSRFDRYIESGRRFTRVGSFRIEGDDNRDSCKYLNDQLGPVP